MRTSEVPYKCESLEQRLRRTNDNATKHMLESVEENMREEGGC